MLRNRSLQLEPSSKININNNNNKIHIGTSHSNWKIKDTKEILKEAREKNTQNETPYLQRNMSKNYKQFKHKENVVE